jgi:hypothetical protein
MFTLEWDTETKCFHAHAVPELTPGTEPCREYSALVRLTPSVILPNAYGVSPKVWPDYYRAQAFAVLNKALLS